VGVYVEMSSHFAANALVNFSFKRALLSHRGREEVTIRHAASPSGKITPFLPAESLELSSPIMQAVCSGEAVLDLELVRGLFSPFDATVGVSRDDEGGFTITFSSLSAASRYTNSEVVLQRPCVFKRIVGPSTILQVTFEGGMVPTSLPLVEGGPSLPLILRRIFPPRSTRVGPFAVEGWAYPEVVEALFWVDATPVTIRSTERGEARTSLEKALPSPQGAVLAAFPSSMGLAVAATLGSARYGVQLLPTWYTPGLALQACPTRLGDAELGPFERVLLCMIPMATSFLPDPMACHIDCSFHFPSLSEVAVYTEWLQSAIWRSATTLPVSALLPAVRESDYSSPSPLWTMVACAKDPLEVMCAASNWVQSALANGRLISCDLSTRDAALESAKSRVGSSGKWLMVFSVNGRAIYETFPEWESPTLPGYHTLEATSNGCYMAIVSGVLHAAFTSTLRAALVALALAPLGINLTSDPVSGLKSAPPFLPSAAPSTARADAGGGLDDDSIMDDIQGALEAAAAASITQEAVEDASWPPAVHHSHGVPLLMGTASPGFGVIPPSYKACCEWSSYPHEELAVSVGVTAFGAGPLSTVAFAETLLTEEFLDTLATYSVDAPTGVNEEDKENKEDEDLMVHPLVPSLSVSDLSPSDSSRKDVAVPSLPSAGGPAESEIVLDLDNNSSSLDPNKAIEHLHSPHSPATQCSHSTGTDNFLGLRVHSPSQCTGESPSIVEIQGRSQRGAVRPVLSVTVNEEVRAVPPNLPKSPAATPTGSLREGLLRTSPPSLSVAVSSVWGTILSDRAPAPAHPDAVRLPHGETLFSGPAAPRYTESVTSQLKGAAGCIAPQDEFLQIGGPLAVALRDMCPGQVLSRVLGPPCLQVISSSNPFGLGGFGKTGRLRAWDLAMACSFCAWRSLQEGRNSLAAGILLGLSEVGDFNVWMNMGRLLETMLPVSPPDLKALIRYLGGTGGRHALRTLTVLIEKSRTVESSGELDSPTYSLTFPGIPEIRVYSPASALDPHEVDEGVVHLLSYGSETARLYGRAYVYAPKAEVNLSRGDVVVACAPRNQYLTGVITRFGLRNRQVFVRPIGGTAEVATLVSQIPTCPPIFGRFSLHYALAAPSFSDEGASL
jgi:hypothetical protein